MPVDDWPHSRTPRAVGTWFLLQQPADQRFN
jgi:hypothetical protein